MRKIQQLILLMSILLQFAHLSAQTGINETVRTSFSDDTGNTHALVVRRFPRDLGYSRREFYYRISQSDGQVLKSTLLHQSLGEMLDRVVMGYSNGRGAVFAITQSEFFFQTENGLGVDFSDGRFRIRKFDAYGDEEWDQTYSVPQSITPFQYMEIAGVIPLSNGGVAFIGERTFYGRDSDAPSFGDTHYAWMNGFLNASGILRFHQLEVVLRGGGFNKPFIMEDSSGDVTFLRRLGGNNPIGDIEVARRYSASGSLKEIIFQNFEQFIDPNYENNRFFTEGLILRNGRVLIEVYLEQFSGIWVNLKTSTLVFDGSGLAFDQHPWGKIGEFDLWINQADSLYRQADLPTLDNRLAITSSIDRVPITNLQKVSDLAIALQAKLVAEQSGFWSHGMIEDTDVEIFQTDVGFATQGFSYTGDFVLATPGVEESANLEAWSRSMFVWPETVHNLPLRFALPTDGTGTVPTDFRNNLDEAWRTGVRRFIVPQHRRNMYEKTFLFAMFPEAATFSTLADDMRERYREAFRLANSTSTLSDAIRSGHELQRSHVGDYFRKFASVLQSEEAGIAASLIDFAAQIADVQVPLGTAITVGGKAVTASEQHRLVAEMLVIKVIQAGRVERRRDYLIRTFGSPTTLFSGKWTTTSGSSMLGWSHDPAILYGLSDAVSSVNAILAANNCDSMAAAILTSEEMWDASSESQILAVMKEIVEFVVGAAIASNPYGQFALLIYKASVLGVDVHNFLQGELLDTSDAINMMFCAGTADHYIGIWGPGDASSVLGISDYQTRKNIRMLLATVFYGALIRNDEENMFYGSLTPDYKTYLQAQYSRSVNSVLNDYLLTNPLSPSDAAQLVKAAYIADAVPGVVNPPGQFQLSVSAGPGGTAIGSGFFTQNSVVTISATANAGFRFRDWTGAAVTDSLNPITEVRVSNDMSITANFLPEFTVTLIASPENGGIVAGGGVGLSNDTVQISAFNNAGYRFAGWIGSDIVSPSQPSTFAVTNQNRTITASFVKQWMISLGLVNPDSGSVSGGGLKDAGPVVIQATPNPGFRFDRWIGAGVHSDENETTTVNLDQDRSLLASFMVNSTDGYNRFLSVFGEERDITRIAPNVDFDNDSIPNFVEYALGLDPTSTNLAGIQAQVFGAPGFQHLRLSFNARSDDPDIIYTVELSDNLYEWTPVTITFTEVGWVSSSPSILKVDSATGRGDGTWSLVFADQTLLGEHRSRFARVSASSRYHD